MIQRVLTEETIKGAILQLEKFWWPEVLRMWAEYIPQGVDMSDEDKLGWAIASYTRAEFHLASYLSDDIKLGPYDMEKPTSEYFKPTLVAGLKAKYPAFMHEVALTCAQGKGIPDKYKQNEDWLCCVALRLALEWDDSYACDSGDVETLQKLLSDWLEKARAEIRGGC